MKASLFLAATSVLQLAAALPAALEERDLVVVTATTFVTVGGAEEQATSAPVAAVPVATVTTIASPAPEPTSQAAAQPAAAVANAPVVAAAAVSSKPQPAPSAYPASSAQLAGPSASSTASAGSSGLGLTYSPYNADNSCKTKQQVAQDFEQFTGYGTVRIYGVDCSQVPNVVSAAASKNMKVFLGIFDVTQVASEMQTLIQGVGSNWDKITAVGVGNEIVNSQGAGMVPTVVSAVQTARSMLKNTAFKGSVVTVDTFDALTAHPQLCQASDFAAANAHAFFDAQNTASNAGSWLKSTVQSVKSACGNKNVVITESGWPSQGTCNGNACPSLANQKTAISSIKSDFSSNVYLFNAYNDLWKTDFPGSFSAEKYWGIFGTSST